MADFTSRLLRPGLTVIEQGHVRCFLAAGRQEALLIDAGLGGGDLLAYVRTLTEKPVTALFTHADPDHVGHAGQFEHRLMHPSEFDYYRQRNKTIVPMEPVWEGDILDLDGFRFEVILIPGHTPGSIALLEREQRFLIGGDSIQTGKIFMFGNGRNFDAFRASMLKMQKRIPEFDQVYASHYDLEVAPYAIHHLYEAAGKVMAGQVDGVPNDRGLDPSVLCYATNGVAFFSILPL